MFFILGDTVPASAVPVFCAINGIEPLRSQLRAGGCICGRHKLAVELPAGGDGIQRAPDAHPQPRKESGLKCRGFDALGTANRYALNVRLHLHEEVALRGPSQLSAMLQGTSGLVDRGSKI